MRQEIFISLKTVSEANNHEHWSKQHKRHKGQKTTVRFSLLEWQIPKKLPVTVTMTRLSTCKMMDSDNLQSAFKYIRDAISEYLIPGTAAGHADSDPRITWQYDQVKSKLLGIRLIFEYPFPDDDQRSSQSEHQQAAQSQNSDH